MEIHIVRCSFKKEDAQVGLLLVQGRPRLITLERPDWDNQKDISCIPTGTYLCKRGKMWIGKDSERHLLETFLVTNVPGRSDIGFHPANYYRELRGCIALGNIIDFDNNSGIGDSRRGFQKFMEILEGKTEFTLIIKSTGAL